MGETIVVNAGDIPALTQALARQSIAPVGEDGELSGLDKRIIKMANSNMSLQEMADELGGSIRPERIGQRLREIIRSRGNVLSAVEKQLLLLDEMIELKDIIMDRVRSEGGYRQDREDGPEYYIMGDPRWSANAIRLFKELRESVLVVHELAEKTKKSLNAKDANTMFRAIEVAFERFAFRVDERVNDGFEKLTYDLMLEIVEEVLPLALAKIEEATSDD